MQPIKTILHPTGFSDNSVLAFQMACGLAADYSARLILLHVRAASPDPLSAAAVADPSAAMREAISRFPWPKPPDPRVHVEHRLAEGDSATEILRVAESAGCDLIVMGTHGRTGLGRLLNGSVAEAVTRRAPCPVLAVKSPLKGIAVAAGTSAAASPDRWSQPPKPLETASVAAGPPPGDRSIHPNADLATVIEAWPTLPAPFRAGILAMIRSQKEA